MQMLLYGITTSMVELIKSWGGEMDQEMGLAA
jgi:hypothetical protein